MSRVLITGIEGFAGSHLARHLSQNGHHVIGIHLAQHGDTIRNHVPIPPGELHQGDIRDLDRLKSILASTRPDSVVHLAAVSSVAVSEGQLLETYDINAVGTLKLLEALRQQWGHDAESCPHRVLLISSADVYGRATTDKPLTEGVPPQPITPYALSKLAAEDAGRFFHRAFGMDIVVLRPFSHTGPGQKPDFIFPSIARRIVEIERAAEANPMGTRCGIMSPSRARTIELGNLDVRRDYTDVRDVARAYALALERCKSNETYNITSGRPILLRDGIETLCRLARCEVSYTSTAAKRRKRDLSLLTGDPMKFSRTTGWQPVVPFETTLQDLLDYYRSRP